MKLTAKKFKSISYLIFLIVFSALGVSYISSVLNGLIDLFAFDTSASDVLSALPDAIVAVFTALIMLPLLICIVVSLVGGWKLFLSPHNVSSHDLNALSTFPSALRIYVRLSCILTSIAYGLGALVMILLSLFELDMEFFNEFGQKLADFGFEDAGAVLKSINEEPMTIAIEMLITMVLTIVFSVLLIKALGKMTNYFKYLAAVAEGSEAGVKNPPVVMLVIGAVVELISVADTFISGSVAVAFVDVALVAYFIVAIIFFKSLLSADKEISADKEDETTAEPEKDDSEEADENGVSDEQNLEESAEFEVASATENVGEPSEEPAAEETSEVGEAEVEAVEEVEAEAEPESEVAEEDSAESDEKSENNSETV